MLTHLKRSAARVLRRLLAVLVPINRMDRARCQFANDTDTDEEDT